MDSTILEVIPGNNPSGANLRHAPIYDEIRSRVRRARGGVFLLTEEPEHVDPDVDWRFAVQACRDILKRQSKDLMIAAWLTEAQYALEGFAGLGDGLEILRGLTEKFWETLYPEIEDGDTETRLRIFEWVDTRLAEAVRTASVSGLDQNTSDEARRQHNRDREVCIDTLNKLKAVCEEKFGAGAPTLPALRYALLSNLSASEYVVAESLDFGDFDLQFPEESTEPRANGMASPESALPGRRLNPHPSMGSQSTSESHTNGMASPESAPRRPRPSPPFAMNPPSASPEKEDDSIHVFSPSQSSEAASSAPAPSPADTEMTEQKVEFTLTAPAMVAPQIPFELFVWAHEERERSRVLARAREELGVPDLLARTKGPIRISSGTVLSVRLDIPGAAIDTPEDSMVWEGVSTCVSFVVTLPEVSRESRCPGTAHVYANGIQVAKISFVLSAAGVVETTGTRYRKAFASYASDDRDAVLGRIQGIHKVAPEMEIFLDVASLRSGQNWEQELWRVIPASDIFYLFWSHHARNSEWVEKEWRCALRERGIEFIDPVPLESPRESPPPPELSSLHFNDWELAFRRCSSVP